VVYNREIPGCLCFYIGLQVGGFFYAKEQRIFLLTAKCGYAGQGFACGKRGNRKGNKDAKEFELREMFYNREIPKGSQGFACGKLIEPRRKEGR
jgi:hypothetical protein